ncbi:MAG: BREX-3 system P-loop-containing protein BrxF, partial [Lentisphaerae bacterium]|nr:BREX-3 system P-loop-containing protein BrxF [Lentisphaerota bacterium]
MAEPIAQRLAKAAGHVDGIYNRLVLLVAPSGLGKTQALREFCEASGAPLVNVNLELSLRMLEMTTRQRTLRLPVLFSEVLREHDGDVIGLDNLEIVFDRGLQQDPLRLLQSASRNRTLVATWNGQVSGGKLTYADIGHPEYRSYELDGVQV